MKRATTTELRAEPPNRVTGTRLVVAGDDDHHDASDGQRWRKREQQIERCLVGAVHVVEQQCQGLRLHSCNENRAHRLDEAGAI